MRIVASAIEELVAEGKLSLTLKMGALAKQGGFCRWNKAAIEHLVKVIGTPRGALWEQGHRRTSSYGETWAVLVPAREVAASSQEQKASVGTETSMVKTFED